MREVLWEEDEMYGFVVEPAERFAETCATLESLRDAETWAEIRSAQLATWARLLVDEFEQELIDELGSEMSSDEPFVYDEIADLVSEAVPLPHDAGHTASWLGMEILTGHSTISGASPGGHGDSYSVKDRDAFLQALREAGFSPVHRSGMLKQLFMTL